MIAMEQTTGSADPVSREWLRFDQFSAPLLYEVLGFRQAIFVVEQHCPYPDLDGVDQRAEHLLLRQGDALAGYLRLIPDPAAVRVGIGRVAVAAERRGQGFARRLMTEALARCRSDWPQHAVTLAAQAYLTGFYETLGFRAISAPFDDYGIPHVEMKHEG